MIDMHILHLGPGTSTLNSIFYLLLTSRVWEGLGSFCALAWSQLYLSPISLEHAQLTNISGMGFYVLPN